MPKTKGTILQNLGFAKTQIYDFETLADNKDLVEQVKAVQREPKLHCCNFTTRNKSLTSENFALET